MQTAPDPACYVRLLLTLTTILTRMLCVPQKNMDGGPFSIYTYASTCSCQNCHFCRLLRNSTEGSITRTFKEYDVSSQWSRRWTSKESAQKQPLNHRALGRAEALMQEAHTLGGVLHGFGHAPPISNRAIFGVRTVKGMWRSKDRNWDSSCSSGFGCWMGGTVELLRLAALAIPGR